MTKEIVLNAEKREEKNLDALRESGFVPAVVYGPVDEPTAIKIKMNEFLRVWKDAGESTIIDIKGLGEDKEVLIKEVQMHPVKDLPLHVDFYAIERGKTLTLNVPLEFEGEAPAEKLGGVIVKVMHEVEVETRPRDIPQHLTVNLEMLENLDSVIKVSDITLPEGVEMLTDADEVVVSVSEQQEEIVDEPQESTETNAEQEQATEAENKNE